VHETLIMDSTGIISLISLIILSIIDFLNLKKLKIPVKKCLINALLGFLISFFAVSFLGIILSMVFDSFALSNEFFLIISLVLITIFNYLRITDRVIKNKKIASKKNSLFEKIWITILILLGVIFFLYLIYSYITGGVSIWNLEPSKMIVATNSGLTGLAYTLMNNLMINLFGSFAYKISAILLIAGGTCMLVGILTMGYYLTKSLFKKNEKN
jgi:hypothetical protein